MYDQYCLFFGLTLIFHKESISLFAAYKDSQKIYLRSTERSFRTLAMPMLRINRLKKGLKFCANVRNLKTTQNTQLCVIKPSPTYFTFYCYSKVSTMCTGKSKFMSTLRLSFLVTQVCFSTFFVDVHLF